MNKLQRGIVLMMVFDTDEYLVPMGKYESLKDVIRDAVKGGTEVLSFRSSRGKLRRDASVEDEKNGKLEKDPNATYLEAYNCDSGGIPKPTWAERARKQIYRSDYVMYHFVHYSTVTKSVAQPGKGEDPAPDRRGERGRHGPHEDDTERHDGQLQEEVPQGLRQEVAGVLGRRTLAGQQGPGGDGSYSEEGLDYNCFVNEKVDKHWVPKLKQALRARRESLLAADGGKK